jgi:hypothetical protein
VNAAVAIREEIVDAELVDDAEPYNYASRLAFVRDAAERIQVQRARVEAIERAETIAMARCLLLMREDPAEPWRQAGDRSTDNAFAMRVAETVPLTPGVLSRYLNVGRTIRILESSPLLENLPGTAGQVLMLSAAYLRKLPDADRVIPNLWIAAVEDVGGGQPPQELVESKVKRYVRDRKAADTLAGADLDDQSRRVVGQLRAMRRRLEKLHAIEPARVDSWVRMLVHDLDAGAL